MRSGLEDAVVVEPETIRTASPSKKLIECSFVLERDREVGHWIRPPLRRVRRLPRRDRS